MGRESRPACVRRCAAGEARLHADHDPCLPLFHWRAHRWVRREAGEAPLAEPLDRSASDRGASAGSPSR
eukprot:2379413-Heterocapsa_arctica.AAC.1